MNAAVAERPTLNTDEALMRHGQAADVKSGMREFHQTLADSQSALRTVIRNIELLGGSGTEFHARATEINSLLAAASKQTYQLPRSELVLESLQAKFDAEARLGTAAP